MEIPIHSNIDTPNQIGRSRVSRPEEELRTLRLAVEQSRDGINIVDLDGAIIYANPASEAMYGCRKGQLVGRHVSVLNVDPGISRTQVLPAVISTGNWSGELIQKRQDGSHFPVYLSASMVTKNNTPIGMLGIVRDITESKQSEDKLRQSEEKFKVAFHTTPSVMGISTLQDGRYLEINKAFETILGYSRDEVIGSTSSQLGIWTQHAQRQKLLKILEDQGYLRDIETVLKTKSGGLKTFIFSADIIKFQGVSCIMSAWLDISERKRAEDALQQLNLTLEDQVAQRTAIAKSRMQQLRSLAVELIEAEERERKRISELLHDDFQQTLAAARFQLESALENLPPTPELMDVEGMLADLISKARQLSHELSPAVLHHSGLVGALNWLCRNMNEQFGLDVHLTAEGVEQHESTALSNFVFRAVQELLFNVAKHAGVKRTRVSVAGVQGQLTISVSDSGKGFDPSILKIPDHKGGIGLLSLRERASYIGGSLVIESAPGAGSHFMLTIPAAEIAGAVVSSIPCPGDYRNENEPKKANGRALRVLFADDHKVLRQGLIKILSGQPNIIVAGEAVNGLEAVQFARRLKPDVIVMDVSMPEMDGIEATRRIKAELPDIRVIGLSMHTDEHISQLMRDAGAEAFVAKTASSAELLKAIYGW